jgi:hypothetical protein
MKYVLAAIDGTGSRTWAAGGASSVRRFHDQFQANGGHKSYFHGPNNEMTGSDTENILQSMTQFVLRSYMDLSEEEQREGRSNGVRVFLVGHSRGGYAAIRAAAAIRHVTPVEFLGLYDAVDRTTGTSAEVIRNVRHIYHARRSPRIGSRDSFGNTGLRAQGGTYNARMFMTSHGGVGGDPERNPTGIGADLSCAEDFERRRARSYSGYGRRDPVPFTGRTGARANRCESASQEAERWIHDKAAVIRGLCERVRAG